MPNKMKSNTALKKASIEEKTAFITVLCTLAHVDGKNNNAEIVYIDQLAQQIGIELDQEYFKYTVKQCLKKAAQIKNRRVSLELIKNMFVLAYTDDNFSDSEGEFICAIGDVLKIEPAKIMEISSWITNRIIWLEQQGLIFEEN